MSSQCLNNRSLRRVQLGLTLLEMLVVMAIVGMVATLIMQGFSYTMGIYQRVVADQNESQHMDLVGHWYRNSLESLVPSKSDGRVFTGSAVELRGYSFQPLMGQSGLQSQIVWKLEHRSAQVMLGYQEQESYFPLVSWDDAVAHFEYFDETGVWNRRWPVGNGSQKKLPEAIRLTIEGDDTQRWVVKVKTRKTAEVFLDEILYGRD